jgi:hypothetical protein
MYLMLDAPLDVLRVPLYRKCYSNKFDLINIAKNTKYTSKTPFFSYQTKSALFTLIFVVGIPVIS